MVLSVRKVELNNIFQGLDAVKLMLIFDGVEYFYEKLEEYLN